MLKRRKPINPIGHAGRLSEKRLAKELGARLRPSSGAMDGAKGDMTVGAFLLEAKSTVCDSLNVRHDWVCKIAREARSEGKTPALSLSFTGASGKPWPDGDWVCIPRDVFEELFL